MTALLGVAPFKGIDPAELDRIEATSRTVEPRDGSSIFAEGDVADAVYAIIGGSGHVRIGALDRNSKGLMIEVFGTGDIFGEIGVIDGSTRSAHAVAEGRVRLLRIGGRVFMDMLHSNPMLGANLCRRVCREASPDLHPATRCDIRKPRSAVGAAVAVPRQARGSAHGRGPATRGPIPAGRSG